VTQADGVNTSPEGSGGGADAPLVPDQPDTMWPSDTELIVVPGMNKVTLTIQCPLLCLVFQDAFKNLRVSLLFNNAFPDAAVIPTFIRMALITSAKSHNRASDILKWLLCDEVYMAQMACLVSCMISNRMRLTLLTATCSYFPFLRGSQRLLHHNHTGCLFDHQLRIVLGKFGLKPIQTRFKPNPNHLRWFGLGKSQSV
jgi:hypothetical protein